MKLIMPVGSALTFCLVSSLATADVVFTDASADAGLSYLHWDSDVKEEFGTDLETMFMSGGAAAGDYNNDGWCDLYVTRVNDTNLLFMNNGKGTFTEVGAAAGVDLVARSSGCCFADVDNDGDLDLYVLTMDRNGSNRLYMNRGDGTFGNDAQRRGLAARAPRIIIDPGTADACIRCITSVAFGDYDLDGDLDCALTGWGPPEAGYNRVFENDGNGFFDDVTDAVGANMTTVRGFSPRFADLTGDGFPELTVAADFGTSQIFANRRNGTFLNLTRFAGVGTDENGMGSAIGDWDGDGDLDWFVTSIYDPDNICRGGKICNWGTSGNRLYSNRSTPGGGITGVRFQDVTDFAGVREGGWGWGASFFDFDNDTDLDLGMTNGVVFPGPREDIYNTDRVRLWENDGAGAMTEIGELVGFDDTGSGKGFVVFDYDNDGDLDVYIANNGSFPILYRNDGGNENNWFKLSLAGVTTNKRGIGAWVTLQVDAKGPIQVREVSCDSNYMSHNDVVEHFGVGDAVSIHELRISWPVSGTEQVFNDLKVNQHLMIAEDD